ncbi:MAG: helix-turn-helix transcriptional regulator, partial [Dehalococcoidia bacterium]|nr:helix-turn-helix transcriptional regulator [Dehalococcoidia bacterium]
MTERLRTRIEEVTSRQLEVARLVAEGHTNPEIATSLGITLDGAKYHVSELLGRLGLERREEIADWYRSERGAQRRRRLFSGLFASAPRAFA